MENNSKQLVMGSSLVWKSWQAGAGGPGRWTTKIDQVGAQEDGSQTEKRAQG